MEFWATLIGAAVGVVAGALIQFCVQLIIDKRKEGKQREALRKEMSYNLGLLDDVDAETIRLRNAINGDALGIYAGFLPYDQGMFVQTIALLNSGQLYHWLPIEALKKLQKVYSTFHPNRAVWVNGEITKRKESFKEGTGYSKSDFVNFVNFIEGQHRDVRVLLREFLALI